MSNILEQCPVPILQSPWEFEQLFEVYKRVAPKKVVEIGSFYGGTLWFWCNEIKRRYIIDGGIEVCGNFGPSGNLEYLISIDYPIGTSDGRYKDMLRCRAMWQGWIEGNIHPSAPGVSCLEFHDIQGDSHDPHIIQRVKLLYPDNDVDFLFIDGDHSYEGVKADYENFRSLVRPGGLIVFHDVCGLPEVKQFWDEIKPNTKSYEIHEPNGWGIGIIEV